MALTSSWDTMSSLSFSYEFVTEGMIRYSSAGTWSGVIMCYLSGEKPYGQSGRVGILLREQRCAQTGPCIKGSQAPNVCRDSCHGMCHATSHTKATTIGISRVSAHSMLRTDRKLAHQIPMSWVTLRLPFISR